MSMKTVSGDVYGVLHFYSPPENGLAPSFVVTDASGAGSKNYTHDKHRVLIRDIRGLESRFSLTQHAFAVYSDVPSWTQTVSTEPVAEEGPGTAANGHLAGQNSISWKTNDRPLNVNVDIDTSSIGGTGQEALNTNAIINFVSSMTGPAVQTLVIFDVSIRRADLTEKLRRPVRKVHTDQSPAGAMHRLQRHLTPSEADAVLSGKLRARIITLWRSLNDRVTDHPLAVAEAASVTEQNLVRVRHVYKDRVGESYAIKHSDTQKFWWWSGMGPGDVLAMVSWDSADYDWKDGGELKKDSRCHCAHASFELVDSSDHVNACKRQSIEVRLLLVES